VNKKNNWDEIVRVHVCMCVNIYTYIYTYTGKDLAQKTSGPIGRTRDGEGPDLF